jgi:hypothetical protein
MDNQPYPVVIFSKYSQPCGMFMERFNQTIATKIPAQLLCIDNEKIRKRLLNSKIVDVKQVPTVLMVFPNGVVEKYDGQSVYGWLEEVIKRVTPPPRHEMAEPIRQPVRQPSRPVRRQEPPAEPEEQEEEEEEPRRREPRQAPRQHRQQQKRATDVNDIPFDEEQETDRHRSVPQPRRIRKDESGEFIESQELFSGEQPDIRKESPKSLRERGESVDPYNTIAKAKEFAMNRDQIESEINSQSRRPNYIQRPGTDT